MKLKIGDTVNWFSSGNGHDKCKEGKVVGVVQANGNVREKVVKDRATDYYAVLKKKRYQIMFDIAYGYGFREEKSYLIEVRDGVTEKATPKLYWPKVKSLNEGSLSPNS